jgi:hypothetical protein
MQVNNYNPLPPTPVGPAPRDSANLGAATAAASAPPSGGTPADQVVQAMRDVKMAASFDRPSGRVVTRVIDEKDGEVVHQYPDEHALRVMAGVRKMVGLVVDEKA